MLLTPTEFRLLTHLIENAGMVLTHRQLLTAVWGFGYADATDVLKPTISRLRQKIEQDPAQPQLIQTVHGVGYRFVPPMAELAPACRACHKPATSGATPHLDSLCQLIA